MKTKNVAAITMAYGEPFISKWVEYYSQQFGARNVFVISHGESDFHDKVCSNVNHITVPRVIDGSLAVHRARLMSHFANAFLETHQCILVSDVDELVAVDPDLNVSLEEYLLERESGASAPLGFNVFREDPEMALDWSLPVLQQASLLKFHHDFCKPVLRWEAAQHSMGGHALMNKKFEVDPNLYLFHLKFADAGAHEHFNELAKEVKDLSDRKSMHHWVTGSDFVNDRVHTWKENVQDDLSPKDGAEGCYEVVPFGTNGIGAKVKNVGGSKPFILQEKYRNLV
ncbi:glycosyltransferase family 2 protein [Mangrovicoccus ximenensis]|uniref:glycosyltransferase family 2 protein n=1 Tax=Mangrovicoccus ximenensis TaxID=1911570 RepID=UPI000D3C3D9A|nr:glycosyltransferase family 2 protein [Mangrovicoccus ximenensis]